MPALDTSILVRYLVADDKQQFELAKKLIESALNDESHFVPLSVSIELEWVLRSRYEFTKELILDTFSRLLESREIHFQDESSVEIALSLYTDHNIDFADCFHIAIAYSYDEVPLMTFDRKASRVTGAAIVD